MSDSTPVVNISQGALRGRQLSTDDGCKYYSFQGIPYATPPLGDLRFQAPQPAEPWEGVRDADKEASECCQLNMLTGCLGGDEDCLFINVYSPQLPASDGQDMPVMVFVHGGGFVMGSGNTDLYGPDFLVKQNVVAVTFNYRLGPLGFLSLENETVPGNAGLKDQVAALRWVRDNISTFGGDPDNVTIFGESAGAVSVQYLLLSESSKGLFHRAISQSGSVFNPWALQCNPRENAIRLCSALGCTTDSSDEAYSFLKSVPALDLVQAHQTIPNAQHGIGLVMIFVPSIENKHPGHESFLTDCPENLMKEGKYHQVPYINGFNSDEGLFTLKFILNKEITFENINNDPEYLVPANIPEASTQEVWRKLKKFYFKDQPMSADTLVNYSDLKGDTQFVYGIDKSVKLMSKNSKNLIYYYRFSFGEFGFFKVVMGVDLPGTSHADELGYLFKINALNIPMEKGSNMDITRRRMIKMWTNFAKTGNPTPTTDELVDVIWEPVAKETMNCLEISSDLKMTINPAAERSKFLENAYNDV